MKVKKVESTFVINAGPIFMSRNKIRGWRESSVFFQPRNYFLLLFFKFAFNHVLAVAIVWTRHDQAGNQVD